MLLLKNRLFIYVAMIVLGVVSGMTDIAFLKNIGVTISDIFIKIFQCISLPIIILSLIVTLSNYSAERCMQKIWHRMLLYTLSTTLIAAAIGCLLYLLIRPSNEVVMVTQPNTPLIGQVNYWQYLGHLIPANVFVPFLDHQVFGVLLIGIVTGIAIHYIPDREAKKMVTLFFQGIHGLFLVITKWIVAILPLGLFGFINVTVHQLRQGLDITGIGEYLSVLVLANLIQGLIVLPLWLWWNKINPFSAMRSMMPALCVAFFSKSSAGTLPVTMSTAEKNLQVDPKISRFVLPLCTNINMNGCAAFIFVTVIYLMQNQGIQITFSTMAVWIVVAVIAAIGNAGVPMGCFFLSASLLASMNVPITLLGIILPFYSIIDMIETALNVWSDSCIAKIINDQSNLTREISGDDLPVLSSEN